VSFLRRMGSDAWSMLRNPFGFFLTLREERHAKSESRTVSYVFEWFILFSAVPSLLLPVWKPLTDWAIRVSVVKIPDLHFGNAVYLSMAREVYPLVYSYVGNHLLTWLVCVPILMGDLLATLFFAAAFMHLVFKYILGGDGRFRDALAIIAFGDLPSLLFGFLPYSAAVGLAWTTLLQIPVGFHYLYGVSWNRAFIPYVLFTIFIFVSWGVMGTVHPPTLTTLIPLGPRSP